MNKSTAIMKKDLISVQNEDSLLEADDIIFNNQDIQDLSEDEEKKKDFDIKKIDPNNIISPFKRKYNIKIRNIKNNLSKLSMEDIKNHLEAA